MNYLLFSRIMLPPSTFLIIALFFVQLSSAVAFNLPPHKFVEFDLEKPAGAALVHVDHLNRVWVALAKSGRIALLNKKGVLREYQLPEKAFPVGIAVDSKGLVWYTDAKRNAIANLNPTDGTIKEIPVPTQNSWPFFLLIDSKGILWFSERMGNKIARMDPVTEVIKEFLLPTPHSQPAGMAVTHDNHIFFTQNSNHKIGHIKPDDERIHEYEVPSTLKKGYYYGLAGIASDSKGNIWFAELDGRLGFIERKDSSYGPIREIAVPDAKGRPGGVYVDRKGIVWFTELDGNRISRYFPESGSFERFLIPTGSPDDEPLAPPEVTARGESPSSTTNNAKTSRPFGINGDKEGNIWFSEQYAHKVGLLKVGLESTADASQRSIYIDVPAVNNSISTPINLGSTYIEASDIVHWRLNSSARQKEKTIDSEIRSVHGEFALNCNAGISECVQRFYREGEYSYIIKQGGKINFTGIIVVKTRRIPIKEFSLPLPNRVPGIIESDEKGNIWFTEIGGFSLPNLGHLPPGNHIGRIDLSGNIQEFSTPTKGSSPTSLKIAPDGRVWFTEQLANNIAVFDPKTEKFEEYSLPTPNSSPTGISIDTKRNRIWFTEKTASKIGYYDLLTKKFTEIETPSSNSEPSTIAVDEKGHVWFDERGADKIVRLCPETGIFKEYFLPSQNTRVVGVTPDSRGFVWFLELAGNKIGRINIETGDIIEYTIPTQGAFPFKLTVDYRRDRIWFTEVFGNKIGYLSQDEFVEYEIPTENSMPGGITIDVSGNIWFTQQAGNKIGVIKEDSEW